MHFNCVSKVLCAREGERFSDIANIVGNDRFFDPIRIFHVTRYGTLKFIYNFLSDTKIPITVQAMLIDLIDKSKFAGNNVKFNS